MPSFINIIKMKNKWKMLNILQTPVTIILNNQNGTIIIQTTQHDEQKMPMYLVGGRGREFTF